MRLWFTKSEWQELLKLRTWIKDEKRINVNWYASQPVVDKWSKQSKFYNILNNQQKTILFYFELLEVTKCMNPTCKYNNSYVLQVSRGRTKDGFRKVCCDECTSGLRAFQAEKLNTESAMINRLETRRNNGGWTSSIKAMMSPESRAKRRETLANSDFYERTLNHPETREKIHKTILDKYSKGEGSFQIVYKNREWLKNTFNTKADTYEEVLVGNVVKELGYLPDFTKMIPSMSGGLLRLDIYIKELRLCIEVDGTSHQIDERYLHDEARDKYLMDFFNITTLRIPNEEVYSSIDQVKDKIQQVINKLTSETIEILTDEEIYQIYESRVKPMQV